MALATLTTISRTARPATTPIVMRITAIPVTARLRITPTITTAREGIITLARAVVKIAVVMIIPAVTAVEVAVVVIILAAAAGMTATQVRAAGITPGMIKVGGTSELNWIQHQIIK
jgi:hypothetical protein